MKSFNWFAFESTMQTATIILYIPVCTCTYINHLWLKFICDYIGKGFNSGKDLWFINYYLLLMYTVGTKIIPHKALFNFIIVPTKSVQKSQFSNNVNNKQFIAYTVIDVWSSATDILASRHIQSLGLLIHVVIKTLN